jgi:hypothetical protein
LFNGYSGLEQSRQLITPSTKKRWQIDDRAACR